MARAGPPRLSRASYTTRLARPMTRARTREVRAKPGPGPGPGGAGEKMMDTDGNDAVRQRAVAATTCVLNALRAHTEEEPQRRLAARALLLLSTRCDMVGATFGTLAENVDAA